MFFPYSFQLFKLSKILSGINYKHSKYQIIIVSWSFSFIPKVSWLVGGGGGGQADQGS